MNPCEHKNDVSLNENKSTHRKTNHRREHSAKEASNNTYDIHHYKPHRVVGWHDLRHGGRCDILRPSWVLLRGMGLVLLGRCLLPPLAALGLERWFPDVRSVMPLCCLCNCSLEGARRSEGENEKKEG